MSTKDCGHHDDDRRQLLRRVFAGILGFIILILFIIFLIWIILKPTKPRFTIQDATLYVFNINNSSTPLSSSPIGNTLTTTIQVTITTYNPNERIGIIYQELDILATHLGQPITFPIRVPRAYQGHQETISWSPIINGDAVPISSYVSRSIQEEKIAGGIFISVKASGRVKWKVGTWVSGSYHIDVNCPAYITFNSDEKNTNNGGIGSLTPLKVQLEQVCSVDV